jgi:PKD repeat protein
MIRKSTVVFAVTLALIGSIWTGIAVPAAAAGVQQTGNATAEEGPADNATAEEGTTDNATAEEGPADNATAEEGPADNATGGEGSVAATAEPGVTLDLRTTRGDRLTGVPSKVAYGQDLRAEVTYSGLGSGDHVIVVFDYDPFGFGGRDEIARETVTGDEGEVEMRLPYDRLAVHIDSPAEADNTLEVRAASLRSNGDVFERSDWIPLGRSDTTVYFDGGPLETTRGEVATLSVYGWTDDESKNRIFLELRESDLGGSNYVTQVEEPLSGNAFEAEVTFDPDPVPENDDTLELFVRPNPEEDGPRTYVWLLDLVEPANDPPTAAFGYSPPSPRAGADVAFDASGSSDDGAVTAYEWTFGDGTTASGRQVAHAFDAAGSYAVRLTVTDDAGATDDTEQTVVVAEPLPAFDGPVPGTGSAAPPTDPDGDGRYEDVDGDGEADFADAIALAFVDGSALTGAQRAALDFDGDGDADFDDAVELAFRTP